MLFVVPGIIFAGLFLLVNYFAILEEKNINESILLSWNKARENFINYLRDDEKHERYEILEESFIQLDSVGVEILPQTMPPFPWHFGGQRFHNLFVHSKEIADFCRRNDMRICYDISHSYLTCNEYDYSINEFSREVGQYVAHLHIADAVGVNGEGLQIGEGEMNFGEILANLEEYCPTASFIPEIWQGHKNGGENFWIALQKLEGLL